MNYGICSIHELFTPITTKRKINASIDRIQDKYVHGDDDGIGDNDGDDEVCEGTEYQRNQKLNDRK